jgi:CubicO group peptidase (beta-lactamase class C family)
MKTALAALAALIVIPLAASTPVGAQTTTPAAVTPSTPVPYTALKPKAAKPHKPGPGAAAPAAVPTAPPVAQAAASAPPTPARPAPKPPSPAAAPAPVRASSATPLPAAELEAYVDGVVREAMDREHIAGVTVAVVQNGQTVLKKGYGAASLSPVRKVDPDTTLFRLGSISKTFTWIALMREVDADRIRIDAPVNLYLPEALQIRDQGFRAPVRVINLMDHSAGFEDRALGQLMERSPDRERSLADYLRQERPRRVHAPGAMSSYSNYGAALAGEAVTYVTGRPFERMIEDEILTPLHLTHTTFREARPARTGLPGPMPAALASDISDGFRWTSTGFARRPYEFMGHIAPAGAASSTAGDMGRYMLALLNDGSLEGVTVFGPGAAKAFRTPIRATPPGINGWAHGFARYSLPGDRRGYGHPGATLSFTSNMVIVPDLGLGVFVAANTETSGPLTSELPQRIIAQFYGPQPPAPRPGNPALVAERARYEGHFLGSRRAYGGLESFIGRLRGSAEVRITDDGRLVTRADGDTRIWVPDGDVTSGRFAAATGPDRLVFEMVDGRAARAISSLNTQTLERTGFWNEPATVATLAILSALAAASTIGGVLLRNRREFRETSIQSRASVIQNVQAALWLTSFALFGAWASGVGDVAQMMYGWPGPWLVIASACALVAAAMTVVTAVILPGVWRGGRRVDSWTPWRKTAFSATVLIYLSFSVVLGVWGALQPWAG